MTEIDWNKPVQTRGGEKVRILCIDRPGGMPVVGFLDGCGIIKTWRLNGERGVDGGSPYDLINIPQKHRYYAVMPKVPSQHVPRLEVMMNPQCFSIFNTRAGAEFYAKERGGIVVPVEWEE